MIVVASAEPGGKVSGARDSGEDFSSCTIASWYRSGALVSFAIRNSHVASSPSLVVEMTLRSPAIEPSEDATTAWPLESESGSAGSEGEVLVIALGIV